VGALGVVAGAGDLPRLIAEKCRAAGEPYLVCAFAGAEPGWIADHPHVVAPFEKPGRVFSALRRAGADRVVFAGGLARPRLRPMAFDLTAARLAARILPLLRRGDDALLRGLAGLVEAEGFRLVGAHDILGPLLMPAGDLTRRRPTAAEIADVDRAAAIVAALGPFDMTQGAVVERGLCLGVETLQGTDALLDYVGRTPGRLRSGGGGGSLFKGPKPGQDRRADLPTIGPETVRRAAAAGLAGVAAEAGGALVMGLDATRAEADRLGLFLRGHDPPGGAAVLTER
jgi:DUF1009 family protein